MGLFKIVLAFVLLAPVCQTHQTELVSQLQTMKRPAITRTRRQVPSYLLDLYNESADFDDGNVILALFSGDSYDCYGGSCYSFNGQGTKWTENREECIKRGGDLVSIETDGEWTFLKDKIQGLSNPLRNEWHIGLKKKGSTWKWVNGAPLTITRWQRGQPDGDGPYVVMAKNYPPGTHGGLNDLPNSRPSGYICEMIKGDDGDCHGSSCYFFNGQAKKWTENRQECMEKGGDLVSIETDDEWTFLKDKIQGLSNPLRDEWHIGLKKEGSTWKWVNGAPLTITRWQRGQPSGDGPYVVMAKNYPAEAKGLLNDVRNTRLSGNICEIRKVEKNMSAENLLTFNMKSIQPSEKIERASLRIFKRSSKLTEQQGNFEITVYRLAIPWEKDDQRWKNELVNVATKSVAWRKEGEWIDLDVTSAVKYWTTHKSKNYGLWVSVRRDGVPSSDFNVATSGRENPFLVAFGIDENSSTTGFEGGDVDAKILQSVKQMNATRPRAGSTRSVTQSCSLHDLSIDVSYLGWQDWIIAPRSFSVGYCKGECYFPSQGSNHVVLQSLLNVFNKAPKPCCAPTELAKASVLYFGDNGDVILKKWDMTATSCGCQ